MNNICVIFDLDDTLYNVLNYLKSVYKNISAIVSGSKYDQREIFDFMLEIITI